jgi:alanine racemase
MSISNSGIACLTVRLGAVVENYRLCRRLSGADVAGVVKADGYGLGATEIAAALVAAGCDIFFVARLEEGIVLRPVVPKARIFVLDGARAESATALIGHNLTPVLNSLDEIALWSSAAPGRDAGIHFDTGMSRLGLSPAELSELSAEGAPRLRDINLVLAMSHLACSDDQKSAMNAQQLGRFREGLAKLPPAPASLAASGGILLGKIYAFDLVRPGVGLYGGNPRSGGENPFGVAARLTGRILQLRRVDMGESVGYGATFQVEGPMRLATVALGYADGLMRALADRGAGAIAGKRAPIIGRVSMDLVTLDVTDIPERLLAEGAEVEFLGDTISLEEIAHAAGTANYEILTSLGRRVPRRYTDEAVQ